MQTKITYQGKRDGKGEKWAHFAWLVEINGETFDYHTGKGHATIRTWNTKKPKNLNAIPLPDEWVHIPKIDDVLECLFSVADAGNMSFDDFCDNLGYSNDSIDALNKYRSCMECAKKLRKALGKEYDTELERIEAKNS